MPSDIVVGSGEMQLDRNGKIIRLGDSPKEGKREAKSEPITISKIENSYGRVSVGTPRISSDVVKRGE